MEIRPLRARSRATVQPGERPQESTDLAGQPAHAATLSKFRATADARWDLGRFDAEVRESQAQRWVVYEALRKGAYHPWDYQPRQEASERYMRNHMNLDTLEGSKRFPRGRVGSGAAAVLQRSKYFLLERIPGDRERNHEQDARLRGLQVVGQDAASADERRRAPGEA